MSYHQAVLNSSVYSQQEKHDILRGLDVIRNERPRLWIKLLSDIDAPDGIEEGKAYLMNKINELENELN